MKSGATPAATEKRAGSVRSLRIGEIRAAFPDSIAYRQVGNTEKLVRIEFEVQAASRLAATMRRYATASFAGIANAVAEEREANPYPAAPAAIHVGIGVKHLLPGFSTKRPV